MYGGHAISHTVTLVDRASHLDHILHSDLSDTNYILRIQRDIYVPPCVSSLHSQHNAVIQHSKMLYLRARATGLPLIRDIFTEAPCLM